MNILILSRKARLSSTRRLCMAGRQRGHEVDVVDFLRCSLDISPLGSSVLYDGHRVRGIDAVIPRIGSSQSGYGATVVQQFQLMGVCSANSADSIRCSHDKLRYLQLLAGAGIGMPQTGFAHESHDLIELFDVVGGVPLVVKLLGQVPGGGMILADSAAAAESVVEAFQGIDARCLVQQFIAQSAGVSLRCFVVGDRVVAAVERRAPPGEFRSNLNRGTQVTRVELESFEAETAVRAAKALGLDVAGVDLLRCQSGPLVIAVNSTPELESIEKATGIDIASQIFGFLEDQRAAKPAGDRLTRPAERATASLNMSPAVDELAGACL